MKKKELQKARRAIGDAMRTQRKQLNFSPSDIRKALPSTSGEQLLCIENAEGDQRMQKYLELCDCLGLGFSMTRLDRETGEVETLVILSPRDIEPKPAQEHTRPLRAYQRAKRST